MTYELFRSPRRDPPWQTRDDLQHDPTVADADVYRAPVEASFDLIQALSHQQADTRHLSQASKPLPLQRWANTASRRSLTIKR